jgi:hypothetical protein
VSKVIILPPKTTFTIGMLAMSIAPIGNRRTRRTEPI